MKWIPAIELLPDDEETVIIFSEPCDPPVWLGYHEAGIWYSVDAWRIRVTHWMPLPEPPEAAA